MKKTVVVNIYNFIRMSHTEPSRFIADDFDTVKRQLILVKQHGFPGTYALKHDALMEPRYQQLLKTYLDEYDEISAWWEITEPLCRRAGVPFRGKCSEEYDDRVDSAYAVGYTPEERRQLVDAYMADFYQVFGRYPESIGSWVMDPVTLAHAHDRYGVVAGAICRDQMGTDGFTLWGGWPNGVYYPSRKNEFLPAQTEQAQLDMPVFRLLGPDPIYNFEQDVREGLQGVYTLEPSWLTGRDPKWITWLFDCLTQEDALGIGYAHVGQENNFLWENIRPGLEPQLAHLETLVQRGLVRVETMAQTARWFRAQYRITPPVSFQASRDWDEGRNLSAQWYASANYRLGLLGEAGRLRIRDLFLFRQDYPSRYLDRPLAGSKSTCDGLPVLFPQAWMEEGQRPFIRLTDRDGAEPTGKIRYFAPDEMTARAELWGEERLAALTMTPNQLQVSGPYGLCFDRLPVFQGWSEGKVTMAHQGFTYDFAVTRGTVNRAGPGGLMILPQEGQICLTLGPQLEDPVRAVVCPPQPVRAAARPVPPKAPVILPGDVVLPWGSQAVMEITAGQRGEIRYTLDGTEPDEHAALYTGPVTLAQAAEVRAKLFLPDVRASETGVARCQLGLQEVALTSPTTFDVRPVFRGNGIGDLLQLRRGSDDYLDGRWRGTLENLAVTGVLAQPVAVKTIALGFLSHHRAGIILPESVELYTGPSPDKLALLRRITLPCAPGPREIFRQDVEFPVDCTIGAFRLVAKRYAKMPQWCCYRGVETVFTMADSLIVTR